MTEQTENDPQPESQPQPPKLRFDMRRMLAASSSVAVLLLVLSYCANLREQRIADTATPPAASLPAGAIPDTEAQAAERAEFLSASQVQGMTAPPDEDEEDEDIQQMASAASQP